MEKVCEESKSNLPYYSVNSELAYLPYLELMPALATYSISDICFICDITGSMNKYIEIIQNVITSFLDKVSNMISHKPRIAFIGFKDKKKEKDSKKKFTSLSVFDQIIDKDFTLNWAEMKNFIKDEIYCDGGYDLCEDLTTPLKKCLNLNWRSDLNCVYLLLDAPTHGRNYYDKEVSDNFPEDDKEQLLEKLMCHYRDCRIGLVILKTNDIVDHMIDIMKKYYNSSTTDLKVIELNKKNIEEDFNKYLIDNMTESYNETIVDKIFIKKGKDSEGKNVEEHKIYSDETEFKGKSYSLNTKGFCFETFKYEFKLEIKPGMTYSCTIKSNSMESGQFINCHHLKIKDKYKYVAKVPKIPVKSKSDLYSSLLLNNFLKYFTNKFTIALNNAYGRKKGDIEYKEYATAFPLYLLEIKEELFEEHKYILYQSYFEDEYIKYNNNTGWVNDKKSDLNLLAQAFSHFTYDYSRGAILIVDIQGVGKDNELTLTDPVIHSPMYGDKFGSTNFKKKGILRFFKTHECNYNCQKLQLVDYKKLEEHKLMEIKEKYKGNEKCKHLYEEINKSLNELRIKIRSFNEKNEPISMEDTDEYCEMVKPY